MYDTDKKNLFGSIMISMGAGIFGDYISVLNVNKIPLFFLCQ